MGVVSSGHINVFHVRLDRRASYLLNISTQSSMSYNSKARGDPNKNKLEKLMNHHRRPATSFAYINPLKKNSKFLGKIRWELSTQFNYRLIAKYPRN